MDEVVAALEKADVVGGFGADRASSSDGRWLPSSPASCSGMRRASWASTCAARWAWRSACMKASRSAPEGTAGLITYMRTDSPRVAPEAIEGAREWISKKLGAQYLPESPNRVQGQEGRAGCARSDPADGCLRVRRSRLRSYLSDEQFRLYTLIWQRFVASQMMPAIFDVTTAKIAAVSPNDRQDL